MRWVKFRESRFRVQRALAFLRRDLWLIALVIAVVSPAGGAVPGRTVYSQTSNRELKQKALRLVKRIREVVYSYNEKDREILAAYDGKPRPSNATAETLRRRWIKETDELHESTMKRYREQYWSDAILLANEILQRLPKQKQPTHVLALYYRPTNVLGVQAVADHLELIAKLLPD